MQNHHGNGPFPHYPQVPQQQAHPGAHPHAGHPHGGHHHGGVLAPHGMPHALPPSASYEFGPDEDRVIGQTALWAKIVAIVGFVSAGFSVLGGNITSALVSGAIALMMLKGSNALSQVSATRGHDVHHVIQALEQFGQVFQARLILLGLAVLALLLMLPLVLILPQMLMQLG